MTKPMKEAVQRFVRIRAWQAVCDQSVGMIQNQVCRQMLRELPRRDVVHQQRQILSHARREFFIGDR